MKATENKIRETANDIICMMHLTGKGLIELIEIWETENNESHGEAFWVAVQIALRG